MMYYRSSTDTYHPATETVEVSSIIRQLGSMAADERRAAGYDDVVVEDYPHELARTHIITEVKDGGHIRYDAVLRDLGQVKAMRKAEASETRKALERGGYVYNGAAIRTDGESTARLGQLVSLFDKAEALGEVLSHSDWEAQPGLWITLTRAEAGILGVKVGLFVQQVFSACRVHHDAIDAIRVVRADGALDQEGSIRAVLAYDLSAGWP